MCDSEKKQNKAKKRLLFAVRLIVTVGLIAWFCIYMIPFDDHVLLKDGTIIKGSFQEISETTIIFIDKAGNLKNYSISDDLSPGVRLKDGTGVTGEVVQTEKDRQNIMVGGKPYEMTKVKGIFDKNGLEKGFWTNLISIKLKYVVLVVFGIILTVFLTSYRWRMLVACHEIKFSVFDAFKLTYLGFFFNCFLMGITGGDVIKAYYLYKRTHKKAAGVMSVFLDRGIGLLGLIILGAACLVYKMGYPGFEELAKVVFIIIGVMIVGGMIFFSRRLRKIFRVDAIIEKLPFAEKFQRLNEAVFIYRYHMKSVVVALLFSIVVHTLMISMIWVIAYALGYDNNAEKYVDFLALMPLALLVSAIPVSISGWGLGELAYVVFLSYAGLMNSEALTLSITMRLLTYLASSPGSLVLLSGIKAPKPEEMEMELEAAQSGA